MFEDVFCSILCNFKIWMQAKNSTLENHNVINYYKLLQLNFNADFKI